MNYQNVYDRINGELSHLPPELQKYAIQNLMDRQKLETMGKYEEPVKHTAPAPATTPTPAPRTRQPRRTRQQIEEAKKLKEHLRLNTIARRRLTKQTRVQTGNPAKLIVDSV